MYYSFFGRCCNPRSRTCNSFHHPLKQQTSSAEPCSTPRGKDGCPPFNTDNCCEDRLLIKSAALGGFILSEETEKRAAFHVASLNLDTTGRNDLIVQLVFSCNIIANKLKVRLRFQLLKQERNQCFSAPVSASILYYRDSESSEANSFSLSACDCNLMAGANCSYSACVAVEDIEAGGNVLITNPVLIATIAKKG